MDDIIPGSISEPEFRAVRVIECLSLIRWLLTVPDNFFESDLPFIRGECDENFLLIAGFTLRLYDAIAIGRICVDVGAILSNTREIILFDWDRVTVEDGADELNGLRAEDVLYKRFNEDVVCVWDVDWRLLEDLPKRDGVVFVVELWDDRFIIRSNVDYISQDCDESNEGYQFSGFWVRCYWV